MRLVFDASASLNVIRIFGIDAINYLKGHYILNLTIYEVGNALWKEVMLLNRLSVEEALLFQRQITDVYRVLNIVNP